MRYKYMLCASAMLYSWCVQAQVIDTLKDVALPEVSISAKKIYSPRNVVMVNQEYRDDKFLRRNFNGNIMQSLETVPGVRAMSIGVSTSKPMIRGMAFNRVAVVDNGIKQEGQQWGADHGLEIDPFGVNGVNVIKGGASLLYGSDAMGGVIELIKPPTPKQDMIHGNVTGMFRSVNSTIGTSAMVGIKKDANWLMARYTESHYGDYNIPTDTIVYLTRRLPVHNRRLKNTAGYECDGEFMFRHVMTHLELETAVSNVYQKNGFFPGAHGVPDLSRLEDDGDRYNIDLPFSDVNHFKWSAQLKTYIKSAIVTADVGFQDNRRREMSLFHTHYSNQPIPETDPDKELEFRLKTYDASLKCRMLLSSGFEHTLAIYIKHQRNKVGGYSFLMPDYNLNGEAAAWTFILNRSKKWEFSGGVRYDIAAINVDEHYDKYLAEYLQQQGYDKQYIERYAWNSVKSNRTFSDFSFSFGAKYRFTEKSELNMNIGRSFRIPSANELSANGVHHGTFRHEQGCSSLNSEKGWQLDLGYSLKEKSFTITPALFFNYFDNYIFLRPSGEWSILPHAGQVYKYMSTQAIITGGELQVSVDLSRQFTYRLDAEYLFTYNCMEKIPLSFSPQPTLRNSITWTKGRYSIYADAIAIASQRRVDRNEEITNGALIVNAGATATIKVGKLQPEINFSIHNIANRRYYNHLSYYRKIEIPEAGRNIQLLINLPFKKLL